MKKCVQWRPFLFLPFSLAKSSATKQATSIKLATAVGLFFLLFLFILRDLDFAIVYRAWPPCLCAQISEAVWLRRGSWPLVSVWTHSNSFRSTGPSAVCGISSEGLSSAWPITRVLVTPLADITWPNLTTGEQSRWEDREITGEKKIA